MNENEIEKFVKLKTDVVKNVWPEFAYDFPMEIRYMMMETYFTSQGYGPRNAKWLIKNLPLEKITGDGDSKLNRLRIEMKSSFKNFAGEYFICGIRTWQNIDVFLLEFIDVDRNYYPNFYVVPISDMKYLQEHYGYYSIGKNIGGGDKDNTKRMTIHSGILCYLEKWRVHKGQSKTIYRNLEHSKDILELVKRINNIQKLSKDNQKKQNFSMMKQREFIKETMDFRDRRKEEQKLISKKPLFGNWWTWLKFSRYQWLFMKSQSVGLRFERRVRKELGWRKLNQIEKKGDAINTYGETIEIKHSYIDASGNYNMLHIRPLHKFDFYMFICTDPLKENIIAGKIYKKLEPMFYYIPIEPANIIIEKYGAQMDKKDGVERKLTITPKIMKKIEEFIFEMPGPHLEYLKFFKRK